MTTHYGLNPSGGAHRMRLGENGQVTSFETFVSETFDYSDARWVETDWAHYEGYIDFYPLNQMPEPVQHLEGS